MSVTYTTAHSNTGSLTHYVRPGIEPSSSWILVRFITAEPQQELPPFSFLKQGTVGFENQINKCLELAEYLYAKIKNREEFEMVFDGEVSCHPGLDV